MANTKKTEGEGTPDPTLEDGYDYKSAQEVAAQDVDPVESVSVFNEYPKALENYEAREDVETLERRRARESGTTFRDAEFVREELGTTAGGVVTSPQAKGEIPDENAVNKGDK